MKRLKEVKIEYNPQTKKSPKGAPDTSYNNENISWHISLLEMVDPFGWHKLDRERVNYILEKLGYFESLTWNEILIERKKQNHAVPIDQICKEARQRLIEIGQDDITELVSLRLSGKERVWGIRQLAILKLLWWDPEHQVCPTEKKHT